MADATPIQFLRSVEDVETLVEKEFESAVKQLRQLISELSEVAQ